MKATFRTRIFRYSIVMVFTVVLLQLALFAVYEYLIEPNQIFYGLTHVEEEPAAPAELHATIASADGDEHERMHQFEELLVLLVIGLLTIPITMVVIWFCLRHLLSSLERIANTSKAISDGAIERRLMEYPHDDEIGTMVQSLNKAFDRYHSMLESARQFCGDASHQLRTPLTVIRNSGETCLAHPRSDEELRNTISSMLEEGSRMQHIVEQLLSLSRMEHEELGDSMGQVDVGKVADDVADRFRPLAEEHGIGFSFECADNSFIIGNPILLDEAISNLVDNAIQVTAKGGTVHLKIETVQGEVQILVEDTGPGILPADKERIFDRFYRPAHTRHEGSGLGLPIVQAITEALRGKIGVDSSSSGSRFALIFPSA